MSVIEQTPHYTCTRLDDGNAEVLLLVVQLPGVESAADLDVSVQPGKIHVRVPGRYNLEVHPNVEILDKPDLLRFVKKKCTLKAQFRVVSEPAPAARRAPHQAQQPQPQVHASFFEDLTDQAPAPSSTPARTHSGRTGPFPAAAAAAAASTTNPAPPPAAAAAGASSSQPATAAGGPPQPRPVPMSAPTHGLGQGNSTAASSASHAPAASGNALHGKAHVGVGIAKAARGTASQAQQAEAAARPAPPFSNQFPPATAGAQAGAGGHASSGAPVQPQPPPQQQQQSGRTTGQAPQHQQHSSSASHQQHAPTSPDSLYGAAKELANREAAGQWLQKAVAAGRAGDTSRATTLLAKAVALCPSRQATLEAEYFRAVPETEGSPAPRPAAGAAAAAPGVRPPASGPAPQPQPTAPTAADAARGGASSRSAAAPGHQQPGNGHSHGHGQPSQSGAAGPGPRASQPYSSAAPQREDVRPDRSGGSAGSSGSAGGPWPNGNGNGTGPGGSQGQQRQQQQQQQAEHQRGAEDDPPGWSSQAQQDSDRKWDWALSVFLRLMRAHVEPHVGPGWGGWLINLLYLLLYVAVASPFFIISVLSSLTHTVLEQLVKGGAWEIPYRRFEAKCVRHFRYMLISALPLAVPVCGVVWLVRTPVWYVGAALWFITATVWGWMFWEPHWLASAAASLAMWLMCSGKRPLLKYFWPAPLMLYCAGQHWWNVLAMVLQAAMFVLAGSPVRAAVTSSLVTLSIRSLAWYQALPAVVVELVLWLFISAASSPGSDSSGRTKRPGARRLSDDGDDEEYFSGPAGAGEFRFKGQDVPGATGDIARVLRSHDHFEVLGLDWRASEALSDKDVKDAKRNLLLKVHPDKTNGAAGADEAAKRVNAAAEKLVTEAQRRDAVAALRRAEARASTRAAAGAAGAAGGGAGLSQHLTVEIPCNHCGGTHMGKATTIDSMRARYCGECRTHHPAFSGDGWVWTDPEALLFPETKVYMCLDGIVFDITDFAKCCDLTHDRTGKRIPANMHLAPFCFGGAAAGGRAGGKAGGGAQPGASRSHGPTPDAFKGKGGKGQKKGGKRR